MDQYRLQQICEQYGYAFYSSPQVSSTMKAAPNLNFKDHVHSTELQSFGGGRGENVWQMEPSKDIAFTIHKYLNYTPQPFLNNNIGFAILKLLQAIFEQENANFQFKWPNDIYLNQQKICGILVKTDTIHELTHLMIGVGINVNSESEQFASLKQMAGKTIDRTNLLEQLIMMISSVLDLEGAPEIDSKDDYLHGKKISFTYQNQLHAGDYCGFDINGLKLNQDGVIKNYFDALGIQIIS